MTMIGGAGDQIVGLQQPVDRSLRHEVSRVSSVNRTASSRGDSSDCSSASVEDRGHGSRRASGSTPGSAPRAGLPAPPARRSEIQPIVPAVEGGAGRPVCSSVLRAGRCDCSTILMISSFSDAGYLMRLRLPIRDHAFFEQAVLERQIGDALLQSGLGLTAQILHLVGGGGTGGVAGQAGACPPP